MDIETLRSEMEQKFKEFNEALDLIQKKEEPKKDNPYLRNKNL